MQTQAQGRQDSVVRLELEIDTNLDIPMIVLSVDAENKILKTELEYNKNKILTFEESLLFLTICTNNKKILIRCETLLRRNYSERVVNNEEGQHLKWSAKTALQKN